MATIQKRKVNTNARRRKMSDAQIKEVTKQAHEYTAKCRAAGMRVSEFLDFTGSLLPRHSASWRNAEVSVRSLLMRGEILTDPPEPEDWHGETHTEMGRLIKERDCMNKCGRKVHSPYPSRCNVCKKIASELDHGYGI